MIQTPARPCSGYFFTLYGAAHEFGPSGPFHRFPGTELKEFPFHGKESEAQLPAPTSVLSPFSLTYSANTQLQISEYQFLKRFPPAVSTQATEVRDS